VGLGALNPNFALKLGKPEVVLGKLLMGDGRPSGGPPSLKIWEGSDKKWGDIRGPILGSKFLITPASSSKGKALKPDKKLSYRRGTARRVVSVETVQTVAQMFIGLHLISPATDELPTAQITCKRCIKVDLTVVVLSK